MATLLKDVKVKWVWADKPNKFDKYSVTAVLTDEQAAILEGMGIPVKDRDGEKTYDFTLASQTKKGKSNKMEFFDRYGSEFNGMIPDGTSCDILFDPYEWEAMGRKGVKGYFRKAKINDDVMPDDGLEFDKVPEMLDDSPF